MKHVVATLIRLALFALVCFIFSLAAGAALPGALNLAVVVAGVWLAFPLTWIGRKFLDRRPTAARAVWTTTLVHVGVGLTFGVPLVRAIVTHRHWSGWTLPVPSRIGLALVLVTGAACSLIVLNLALRGLGAPAIALSRRLASDWCYAWTRNPMVLAALALFLSLGIWFRSALFTLWVIAVFAPALLFFVKVFEERELELRFGAPYLEYKARTPMLLPRRPGR